MDINETLNVRQFKAVGIETKADGVYIRGELFEVEKACPCCKKETAKPHQYYQKKVRHVAMFNQPTYLCFKRQLMHCECGKLFLERLDFVDLNRQYTGAYENHIYELCRGQSMERVAELEGLSWDQVRGILKKGGHAPAEILAKQRRWKKSVLVSG